VSNSKSGAVLLITFKRTLELEQTINHLRSAWDHSYSSLFVILHEDFPEVAKVIEKIDWINPEIIKVKDNQFQSSATKINRNLYLGLSTIFSIAETRFVTVIEDDICVSSDFLKFSAETLDIEISNSKFMGINGFSGAEFKPDKTETYGRFRFGFGWGWTTPRRTWERVREDLRQNPEMHWDGLIESKIKLGYVVMPHNSKILNVGFGVDASHTTDSTAYEILLNRSFSNDKIDLLTYQPKFSIFNLNWRSDAISYISPIGFRGKVIDILYKIMSHINIATKDQPATKFCKKHTLGLIQKLAIALSTKVEQSKIAN
jgi:hypothetical protein